MIHAWVLAPLPERGARCNSSYMHTDGRCVSTATDNPFEWCAFLQPRRIGFPVGKTIRTDGLQPRKRELTADAAMRGLVNGFDTANPWSSYPGLCPAMAPAPLSNHLCDHVR